jgi:hypothetical protein
MTTENIQSVGIKNLDLTLGQMVNSAGIANPTVGVPQGVGLAGQGARSSAGTMGQAGRIKRVQGFLTPTNGATSPSWYQFCRVPSDALILSLEAILASGTITTFTGDVTAAFSDAFDGTNFQNQVAGPPSGLAAAPGNALILNPAGTATGQSGANSLFTPAFAFSGLAAKVWTEVMFGSAAGGLYASQLASSGDLLQPIWQVAGFPSNPGGNFDIGVLTTATNSVASALIGMRVTLAEGLAG